MPTLTALIKILSDKAIIYPEQIQLSDTLKDIGLDSLDIIEVAHEIEDHFQIDLPESAFPDPTTTVATLHDAIQSAQSH
jgi:acyl carrier protein